MPRLYITHRGRAGVSFGCLGFLILPFLWLMWYALIAVALVCIVGAVLGAFAGAYIVAWAVVGIDALRCRLDSGWRAHRREAGPIRAPQAVSAALQATITKGRRR